MGLKIVHLLFIACAVLLSLGFGAWCFHEDSLEPNPGYFWLGVASSAVGLGLMVYGAWFIRKSRKMVD